MTLSEYSKKHNVIIIMMEDRRSDHKIYDFRYSDGFRQQFIIPMSDKSLMSEESLELYLISRAEEGYVNRLK